MAISDTQKVDLLYKKYFGVAKTDLATNKSPSNEAIASPALSRIDQLWTQAASIPSTAAATAGIVQAYTGANAVQCTADTTTTPISSVYPSWKTGLTDWIPSEFGATYFVQVWVDSSGVGNPTATGTQIFDSGSGGTGEWNFDYKSGVLNFIGGTIPAVLTSSKVIYVVGYRYIGLKSTNFSNISVGNITISGNTISSNSGNIYISANLVLNGSAVSIGTSDLAIQDPIINLHTYANLAPLTYNDGYDIGLKMHYYDTVDSAAFLGRANDTGYLEWYASGSDVSNVFVGTAYGTIKSGEFYAANATPSTSTTTGALRVRGGAGIQGNVFVGNILTNGYYYANGRQFTSYTNNDVANYLPVYTGNISAGNILVQNIVYTNTISANSGAVVVMQGNGAIGLPIGTTSQRPGATTGYFRYNTELASPEYFDGLAWVPVVNGITDQQITPDGNSLTFTLNQPATTVGVMVSINGVLQRPSAGYSVSGTQITFTETPQTTDIIDIRFLASAVTYEFDNINPGTYLNRVTVTTAPTLVDTIPVTGNTAVNWQVTASDNINTTYKASTIGSINDGNVVYYNEYGVIKSNNISNVIVFTSNISSGNINLWAVGDSSNVTVTFERLALGTSTQAGYLTAGPAGPSTPTSYLINGAKTFSLDNNGNLTLPSGGAINYANGQSILTSITSSGTYSNANVKSYLTQFDGNLVPSANVTYSLGTSTNQWKDLWVSNSTIYVGNTPISVSNGTLLINNAPVTGGTTYSNANVTAYLSTQTFYSNTNIAAYIPTDPTITALQANIGGFYTYSNANVAAYLTTQTFYSNSNVASYLITNPQSGTYSNVNVASYLSTQTFYSDSNVASYLINNPQAGTYSNVNVASYLSTQTFYSNTNVAAYLVANPQSSTYSNTNVAAYIPTDPTITALQANIGGFYTYANATYSTGGGSNYGNANVAAYLVANPQGGTTYTNANVVSMLAANNYIAFGNVVTTYPTLANVTTIFVGNNTTITGGGGTTPSATHILNNAYFGANGAMYARNTYASGVGQFYIDGGNFYWNAQSTATANAVAGLGSRMSLTGTTLATFNGTVFNSAGLITAAGGMSVTSSTGITTNQATIPLFNTSATTINFGGVATTITLGQSTPGTSSNIFVGNTIGTQTGNLTVRARGQYNYTTQYGVAGGYNSPPYTAQSLTGGSGTGMTATYSSTGGYVSFPITIVNPGTGYKNGDVLTLPGGLGATAQIWNYNSNYVGQTGQSDITFTIDGNLILPGSLSLPANSAVTGDFSNSTFNYRTVFRTTTANATTGIYAVPSGTGTGAAWQAANSSNIANTSKIMITTNGSTDVQLVSGINGTGTYLPLSFLTNGSTQMQLGTAGNLLMVTGGNISTTGNVIAGNIVANQYGNSVGTTATYTGNVTAAYFVGNVVSSGGTTNLVGNVSTGNLTVSGNLISTGYGFFPGAYSEASTSSGVFVGNTGTGTPSPRIGFFNGNTQQNWQIDNYGGQFRWFTPGVTQMTLDPTGSLSVTNATVTTLSVTGNATITGNVTASGIGAFYAANRPAFRISGNGGAISSTTTVSGGYMVVDYNQGSYLNTSTGIFTAPVAGLYQVNLITRANSNTGTMAQVIIRKTAAIGGAVTTQIMIEYASNTTMNHTGGSTIVKMAVGDTLKFDVTVGTISFDGNDSWSVAYIG